MTKTKLSNDSLISDFVKTTSRQLQKYPKIILGLLQDYFKIASRLFQDFFKTASTRLQRLATTQIKD